MARPLAATAPGPLARRPASSAPWLARPAERLAEWLRTAVLLVREHRRVRVALLALAVALPLAALGWLWLRQSPFVAVEQVQIVGVHGAQAHAVDAALTQAAHGMSTLEVNEGALLAAVAPLRVVRGLRVQPHFPHGLRIEVLEQPPVADLAVGGERTAVAANGTVLGSTVASGTLPTVYATALPRVGARVSGAGLLGELAVLGAAPAPLAAHIERVYTSAKGLTVAMRNGLLVYFGDGSRPHAKWLSLARVLADSGSVGASYVDVRLPSHPAAGFPAGVTPPDSSSSTESTSATGEGTGSSESTIAALAAALPGGTGPATEPETSSTGTEPASAATGTEGSAAPTSGASTEASASGETGAAESTTSATGRSGVGGG